ncbi:MAG: transposase family protein [Negativicutes bacterium]
MSTLTMSEKKKVAIQLKSRYQKASKKQKGSILKEFIEITGYNHSYAARVLRSTASGPAPRKPRTAKARPCKYDATVQTALLFIWKLTDYLCGKRLAPMLPFLIDHLELHGELLFSLSVRNKLLTISSATIDRLLTPVRRKMQIKGRSHTKPGTLLKHQIPIRTFAEWNDDRPGFLEIDLVGHDGGNPRGEFLFTLDATDVATGWTETAAVRNKAQVHVLAALQQIRERLPFPLLGIDSDNGSEFINAHFLRYCKTEQLTFTRGRACRKNDGCFVEQKNYSIIRQAVGYARFDSSYQQDLLNKLYLRLRLRTNFFQPSMKLLAKTRIGSHVKKIYDTPMTPFQRVLNSPLVEEISKENLRKVYESLNLVALARNISAIQAKLSRSILE